ncbi:CLUMA_CG014965, isoform A [Clunio marinus]|uniref:CLUMA_CG014965, isoform A n=1 Tax=Clunio marinus TaxID=568069 RepID=A0A1J1INE2_9DIPT|nr:CLUMA_CG014965, isoform A [Clunio marinus]
MRLNVNNFSVWKCSFESSNSQKATTMLIDRKIIFHDLRLLDISVLFTSIRLERYIAFFKLRPVQSDEVEKTVIIEVMLHKFLKSPQLLKAEKSAVHWGLRQTRISMPRYQKS